MRAGESSRRKRERRSSRKENPRNYGQEATYACIKTGNLDMNGVMYMSGSCRVDMGHTSMIHVKRELRMSYRGVFVTWMSYAESYSGEGDIWRWGAL